MRNLGKFTTLLLGLALAGCAGMMREAPNPGDPADLVRAKLGTPTAVYALPDGQLLEYASGPMGQYTWMARLGPDGRLQSWEQVLTGEKFATIKVDRATKDEVLRAVGRPAELSRVTMKNYEVWSYRYKEAGVWNSLMHVHFDQQGVVRMMMNGPDPMFEPRDRFGW